MSRIGKIARLPRQIRDQLNRRLDDGEPGTELVAWLNGQPAVQALLKAEFAGRPVTKQNLSEWKQGGFGDWQRHQDTLALARELCDQATEHTAIDAATLSDRMSPLLVARFMAIIKTLSAAAADPNDWKVLHELCADVVALRKGDHSAERLKLERERLRWGIG